MVNLEERPAFVERDGRDPRLYDLAPRPTTRGAPQGWSRLGLLRHRLAALDAMAALLMLATPRPRDVESAAVARSTRQFIAEQRVAVQDEALASREFARATTEPLPLRGGRRAS